MAQSRTQHLIGALLAWLALATVAAAQTTPNLPPAATVNPTDLIAVWQTNANHKATVTQVGAEVIARVTVPNNAALSALASTAYSGVTRVGFATAGDSPPLTFLTSNAPCSLNAGAGDGGSQVPSLDGKCWLASFAGARDIRDWGADPKGIADSRPALAAAVASQVAPGCAVVLGGPSATYKFNSGVSFPLTCHIYSTGRDTLAEVNFATGPLITLTGAESEADHLTITHTAAHTGGADIICDVIRCQIHDIFDGDIQGSSPTTFGPYAAVQVTNNSTLSVLNNVECRNPTAAGVAAGATCILVGAIGGGANPQADIFENITCGLDLGASAPTSCMDFKSGDANVILNPNLLQGTDNILFDPTTGDEVLDTKISGGGFLDSAVNNNIHTSPTGGNVVRIWIDGIWLGDAGNSGAFLDNPGAGITSGFYCNACQIVVNAGDGVFVATSKWSDISLTAGCMGQNADAFAAVAGVNNVTIGGGIKIGTCGGFTANTIGVLSSGASSNWQIQGANFTGSTTAISGVATLTNCRIEGNIGYNPVGVTTGTVGASPATITNGCSPATYYFQQSATNTATVTVAGHNIGTTGAGLVIAADLGPNEAAIITWTGTAPTYVESAH